MSQAIDRERLWRALAEVEDPEFPISVVDLGLIYGIHVAGDVVEVQLTLTSTGCPCIEWIKEDIQRRLLQEPGVGQVLVRLVWDPPWTVARLTEKGRRVLEELGYVM